VCTVIADDGEIAQLQCKMLVKTSLYASYARKKNMTTTNKRYRSVLRFPKKMRQDEILKGVTRWTRTFVIRFLYFQSNICRDEVSSDQLNIK
jgi:hypothetical protein